MSLDNANTSGTTANISGSTLTDSASNTWTLRQDSPYGGSPSGVNLGAEVAIWTSSLTNNIPMLGTVTVTFAASTTAKSWSVYEFPNSSGYANSGVSSGFTGTTPSMNTGSITSGNIVVACIACEGVDTITPDSDTSNGTWATASYVQAGTSGGAGMGHQSQYKTTTGGGVQTYNPTIAASDDMIMGWVEMTIPSGGISSSQYLGFFASD
jgi:hypothetical protein